MRISDWSSDVCSSDLGRNPPHCHAAPGGGCMIDLALIGRDEETKWIPGQSRMWLDDTCPHEASGRSGLRQLYDKMALAGRVRGNEAGRPPLALMVVPLPYRAWGDRKSPRLDSSP